MAEEKGPQWAMATPSVVYLVGVACIGICALLTGWVSDGAVPLVAALLVACGIPTMICGAIELRRGDILFGSINMVFGGLIWFGLGFIFAAATWFQLTLAQLGAPAPPDLLSVVAYFAWGIALLFVLFLAPVAKASKFVMIAFIVLAVGLALLGAGVYDGDPGFGDGLMTGSGICFLVFGVMLIYAGTVFIVNTVYQAPKLWLK
jgi:hypothetical protein